MSVTNDTRRVIVQGVYELFEKEHSTAWGNEARVNRMVFIGTLYASPPVTMCTFLIWVPAFSVGHIQKHWVAMLFVEGFMSGFRIY